MEKKDEEFMEEEEEEEFKLEKGIGHTVESWRVGCVPTLFYVSNFITQEEERLLLENIYKAPVAKWKVLKNRRLQNWGGIVHEKGLIAQDLPPWVTAISRRISEKSGLFPSPINHVLINEYLPGQGIMPHQDGPAYYPVVAILSLEAPVVMDFTPRLSLGVHPGTVGNSETENSEAEVPRLMNLNGSFNKHQPFSVLLMPRSLLIFKDEVYSEYLHGIKDNEYQQFDQVVNMHQITESIGQIQSAPGSDRQVDGKRIEGGKLIHRTAARISLTCRTVTRVHKNWLKV